MADLPDHIDLAVGERVALTLPGLGTAGYVWEHEIVGERGLVDAAWTRGREPEAPVGASAPETLELVGRRPGSLVLRLYQRRPWEDAGRVRRERRVSVRIG
jgi:predicted secreted protein